MAGRALLVYSSILNMEEISFSETFVDFQRVTRRYIPEDSTIHNRRCENLKSYKFSNYNITWIRITKCHVIEIFFGVRKHSFVNRTEIATVITKHYGTVSQI
jgi:hypothetical protein